MGGKEQWGGLAAGADTQWPQEGRKGHLSWATKKKAGPPSLPQKLEQRRALTWPLSPHGQQWLASLVLPASLLCALGQPSFS